MLSIGIVVEGRTECPKLALAMKLIELGESMDSLLAYVRPRTHRLSIGIARLENLYVCLYTELYLILQKFPSIVEGKLKTPAFKTWHCLKIQEISSRIFGRKSHFPECNAAVDLPWGEKVGQLGAFYIHF